MSAIQYYSTKSRSYRVDFRRAVLDGLAPDGGLLMPERIPAVPSALFRGVSQATFQEVAYEGAKAWLDGVFGAAVLAAIVERAFSFAVPIRRLTERIHVLELFEGPTLAFKDFGARFLAQITRELTDKDLTVLVSTSGDTGSAIASAFFEVPGVRVVLLYPQGGVSFIQEQQLTTMGGNVSALEVEGTFDDCQRLVKQAFLDQDLSAQGLVSANSINIARLLPQSFYYLYCGAQLNEAAGVISVPSGNFGNLTSGLIAQRMGLPVRRFIAATNVNSAVPEYLAEGSYRPRPSIKTISNAMDVGDPSNFSRLLELAGQNVERMRRDIHGERVSDDDTKRQIERTHERFGYVLDPHGAVGLTALERYLDVSSLAGVVLETAHPAKFAEIIEPLVGNIEKPARLAECLTKPKQSTLLPRSYEALKRYLRDAC